MALATVSVIFSIPSFLLCQFVDNVFVFIVLILCIIEPHQENMSAQ